MSLPTAFRKIEDVYPNDYDACVLAGHLARRGASS